MPPAQFNDDARYLQRIASRRGRDLVPREEIDGLEVPGGWIRYLDAWPPEAPSAPGARMPPQFRIVGGSWSQDRLLERAQRTHILDILAQSLVEPETILTAAFLYAMGGTFQRGYSQRVYDIPARGQRGQDAREAYWNAHILDGVWRTPSGDLHRVEFKPVSPGSMVFHTTRRQMQSVTADADAGFKPTLFVVGDMQQYRCGLRVYYGHDMTIGN